MAVAVEHDASAHVIGGPPTATDAPRMHCLVCHLARSFRPQAEARVMSAPAADTGTATSVELFTAAVSAPAAQPPLRSPPSFPVEA